MDRLRLREVILVEGRYDKHTLSQVVDGLILETNGFGIFKDKEKAQLLRKLALRRGVILLTDSDGAGFVIRGHLRGILPPGTVKEAYIPDRPGKERRKRKPGREGKLGVEGMSPDVLREAILRAGPTLLDGDAPAPVPQFTKSTLYALGLSGVPQAARRRTALLKALDLPENLSPNAMLGVLDALTTPQEAEALLAGLEEDSEES